MFRAFRVLGFLGFEDVGERLAFRGFTKSVGRLVSGGASRVLLGNLGSLGFRI